MTLLKLTRMFAIACVLSFSQQSLQADIVIDGTFADWAAVPVLSSSPTPDGGTYDIHELKVTEDADNFYFYVSLHDTVAVDMGEVRLSIDTDNNTGTGYELNNEFPADVPAGTVGVDLMVTNDFPVQSLPGGIWNGGGYVPFGGIYDGDFISVSAASAIEREWCIPRNLSLGGTPLFGDSFTVSAWTWLSDGQATSPALFTAASAVPEPSSLSLVGVLGIMFARRRRRS